MNEKPKGKGRREREGRRKRGEKKERWIHYKGSFREKLEGSQLTRRWTPLLLLSVPLVFCIRPVYTHPFLLYISSSYYLPHFIVLFILPLLSFPIQAFLFLLRRFPFSESCTSVFASSDHGEFSPLSANSFQQTCKQEDGGNKRATLVNHIEFHPWVELPLPTGSFRSNQPGASRWNVVSASFRN